MSIPSARPAPAALPHDGAVPSALRTLRLERAGIAALEAALAGPVARLGHEFAAAVALLLRVRGRVIVTGMGKSGHVGRKLAATLASTGTPSSFVHAAEASHGDLGMIQADDAVVALSWSGETAELAAIITYVRRFGMPLVALTSNPDSALGRQADLCLTLPKSEEACPNGLAPTTSTTMQLALGDALAVALLEARGFSAHDFKTLHPGGKLGSQLTYVRDVMHAGAEVPRVSVGAAMDEAVVEMTGKRFGCVCALDAAGRLAGLVTDGDLRRHMGPGLMALRVDAVMTARPLTIGPDALAVEALALLNGQRRSVLPVVDRDGVPVGILHIHDLYAIGLA
ncbi:KpsF/GutQ family sugar-phosphate isomerase [Lichenibacterium minor]|uniref:KpsF/GutQ family sugar-phosphate isomerase n=1 Tax=Lichenibacterium minor TaxID=2316528 RepID=A0A4Q2UF28_9HYPH|nr:KpsF/GutQ family sugar-phosphate isomerase [Lichenibacterium minor]RYC33921.1 KpsF/GutQ family sugar-phosphate isomerase [Lichenibacterium minor]